MQIFLFIKANKSNFFIFVISCIAIINMDLLLEAQFTKKVERKIIPQI